MTTRTPILILVAASSLCGCTGAVTFDDTASDTADTNSTSTSGFCDDALDTSPPPGPECLMGTITCGETVTGTTEGGSEIWDQDFHESVFCFVSNVDFDGLERMWAFDQAADTEVTVSMDHCNTAALSVMSWSDTETCPTSGSLVNRCEGSDESGTVSFYADRETRWVIGVDTPAGQEGNFSLTVTCN